ncbi:Hypothetical predicted protein [Octopus vulgaris]|uniref:Uncharacterized protein n=1 Tax=Octopus vulgaris TaxID=6645 RepID=A0AA36BY07_OCTVU|nr:Hypothetical predicted protein [Octopus vulgaris]
MLPSFLHIVTCYRTLIKTDHINTFIDYVKDKCNHMDSLGLNGSQILRNIKRKMPRFLEIAEQNNDFVHQNLDWFQQRLFDIYVTCNPYNHKTIEPPKVTTKFRPLRPVVTREVEIEESGEDLSNPISNIVVIQGGIVTYSRHFMTICCVTRDGNRNDVRCSSSVTDFTRISEDTVLATLPFRKMILIINPLSLRIKRIQLGLILVSYLEHSTLIGVEMFGQTIYVIDWEENRIKYEFITKEIPSDIAVGAQNKLLVSFSNINRVTCYNVDGQQLFEVDTNSLDIPSHISVYQNHFYVLQGHIIYRISGTGAVTTREIGMKCRHISVGKENIFVTDYFDVLHIIGTNEDFWPRQRHSILRCYDLYGQMKWQWELPFPVHPHIAVFQGTLYVPDTQLNRVLLYKYQDRSSGCLLPIKNPYIRNLNLRLKEKENDQKLVIGEICNLSNGQLVVSDINHDCLLYISEEGDIVSRLSLPSTATDICRWDSNHIGVTLPLQKQLRVIGNLSKRVRSVSLRQPYVRVCKMGECEIVCYCDKPSHLDILAINYYNQVEVIKTINIPVFVKSLSIDKKTEKLLIVTRGKAFQYNTRIGGGGRGGRQMVPSVLMSQVKRPLSLQGGSIDQTSVYLIDRSRMFAINDQNLLVNDLVTNNQLNYYIDLVDVFSRHISLSEMLSSTLYLQDPTVSDKARHIPLPKNLGDKEPVEINRLVLTENNLIAGWDESNRNIKIFTLDGHLMDSIKNGEYKRIFLNKRIYKDEVEFSSIDCKGPRFVGSPRRGRWNELYVEGLFMVNRDSFPVARLQTDECPVQVKDFDVSEEGKTVVCEKANNGNVKIFDEDGQLLCHRNVASLVGGVCFTQESHIMATVPKRKEIFQLNGEDLQTSQVWSSLIPYGVIWRKVAGIYWCVHNELIECHCIKIDGDQVNILESVSSLNLDSGLRFPSITSETNKEIFSNELINKLEYRGGDGDGGGRRRGKSGEIIGKGRLKVRCGNYIAEINNSGIDEISVRRLPYRTAMVPFSIPAFEEPVDYDLRDIRDRNSKLIKLDENVSVLMFRESVTLIRTTTTTTVDILQHEQQQRPPLDICRWTEECFIVAFGREMRVFNRDLRRLKTIRTEKYYNRIYKYNDNQLVCGGHDIRDITQEERHKKYQRIWRNNKDYYYCDDPYIFDPYYVDVVDIKDGKCKDEVCGGKMRRLGRFEGEEGVDDVGVTSFGDVVVVRREKKEKGLEDGKFFVLWNGSGKSLW